MKFAAKHVSYTNEDGIGIFALADEADVPEPKRAVIFQFSEEEDEQDNRLGLTGLHIETTWSGLSGYGYVNSIVLNGSVLSIIGANGFDNIEVEIQTSMMDAIEIAELVRLLNELNGPRPN
jgi:hypothetical protein